MKHEICYRDVGNSKAGKHACDDKMLQDLKILKPNDIREKNDKRFITN